MEAITANKYVLTNWEKNGYNASDFFESYWNEDNQTVEFHEIGSTRYANGASRSNYPAISDLGMLYKAVDWLAEHIFRVIRAEEHNDVLEPQKVERGDIVRLIRDCKHKGVPYPAGTRGEVVSLSYFGKFYSKGYNKPGRENGSVGVRISPEPNAPVLYFALKALRLDKEPMADEQLLERAKGLALECQFSPASGKFFAWDTENYALALLNRSVSTQKVA